MFAAERRGWEQGLELDGRALPEALGLKVTFLMSCGSCMLNFYLFGIRDCEQTKLCAL